MEPWVWIVLAVAALVLVVVIVWALVSRRRTMELREQFGPEYERTLERSDGRRAAESELEERRARRERLDIRPLDPAVRERYATQWIDVQARFVDQPARALAEAEELVVVVMRERGYPVDDFEQRAGDVSVDHPHVVEHYRAANAISARIGGNEVSTEEMRQALVHYRALFDEMLNDTDDDEIREAR